MNISELRIGNYVQVIHKGIGKVVAIFKDHIQFENTLGISQAEDTNIEPIPLTPDILDKCGFERGEAPWGGYLFSISYEEKIRIVRDEMMGWTWPLYGTTPVIVRYLHQLQNLIHALTGKELEINL